MKPCGAAPAPGGTCRAALLVGWVLAAFCVFPVFAEPPPAGPSGLPRQLADLPITLRDGVVLRADVYLPDESAAAGRHPVLLLMTPYGRERFQRRPEELRYWTDHGYALLMVDVRGQGESGGSFDFFRAEGPDGHDVVEWAAQQPWSNGRIGMQGVSFSGSNQWYVARERPPHLECITPFGVVSRVMKDLSHNDGAFKLRWAMEWISALSDSGVEREQVAYGGEPVAFTLGLTHRPLLTLDEALFGTPLRLYRSLLEHETLDAWWEPMEFSPRDYAAMDLPNLSVSGWFDGTLPGTVNQYTGMQRYSPADDRSYLIIGPWEHGTLATGGHSPRSGKPTRTVGDLTIPSRGFLPVREITRRFFDACLRERGDVELPPAAVYVTGSEHWLALSSYPPPSELTALYLDSEDAASLAKPGTLAFHPAAGRPHDEFTYDPATPVPEYLEREGRKIRLQSQPVDVTAVQDRPDVLVYESAPLEQPLTVLGNVRLLLYAESDARDTDFTSFLADVHPDGRAIKLGPQSGANARARYRNGLDRVELITPGEPFPIMLDYYDIGHTFAAGHRIRVSVSSSNYPWISANPNTGNPIATDPAEPRKAHQRIHHSDALPSQLLLPIVTAEFLEANRASRERLLWWESGADND